MVEQHRQGVRPANKKVVALNEDLSFIDNFNAALPQKAAWTGQVMQNKAVSSSMQKTSFKVNKPECLQSQDDDIRLNTPAFTQKSTPLQNTVQDMSDKKVYFADSSFKHRKQHPQAQLRFHETDENFMVINGPTQGSKQKMPSMHKLWHNNSNDKGQQQIDTSAQALRKGDEKNQSKQQRFLQESLTKQIILETPEHQKTKIYMGGSYLSSATAGRALEYGPARRMVYENMPEADSDIDSDKQTVNLEGQQPPLKYVSFKDHNEDQKSDVTLGTIQQQEDQLKFEKSQPTGDRQEFASPVETVRKGRVLGSTQIVKNKIENFESSGLIRQYVAETEQSIMTQFVVNEINLGEYEVAFEDVQELQNVQEKLKTENLPISSFSIKEASDYQINDFGTSDFPRNMHQQSQSLEQLPSLKELEETHRKKSFTIKKTQEFSQPSQQFEFKSLIYDEEGEEDSLQNDMNKRSVQTHHMARNFKLQTFAKSEFAVTEAEFAVTEIQGQDPILVASNMMPDNSITIPRGLEDSIDQSNQESVTDTNVFETSQQNLPRNIKTFHTDFNLQESVSDLNLQATEIAASHFNQMDAQSSECVDIGPFEEENSTDWYKPKPKSQAVNAQAAVVALLHSCQQEPPPSSGARYSEESFDKIVQQTGRGSQLVKLETSLSNRLSNRPLIQILAEEIAQKELYESQDGDQIGQNKSAQDFAHQEFNREHAQSQHYQNTAMNIRTESNWINDNYEQLGDFQETHQSRKKSHRNRREVQSFDIRQNQNSIMSQKCESGIEQYESDDVDKQGSQKFASIQQTSHTKEGQRLPHALGSQTHTSLTRDGVGLPHGVTVFTSDSYKPFDSQAFDTYTKKGNEMFLKYEKEDEYNLADNGNQEDPEAVQNAVISVQDECEIGQIEENKKGYSSAHKPVKQVEPSEHVTRDDLKKRSIQTALALVKGQDNSDSASPEQLQDAAGINDSLDKRQILKGRKKRRRKHEKKKSSVQLKSPRGGRSPRGSMESKISKSPPGNVGFGEKKTVIQHGKLVQVSTRDTAFDKQQLDKYQFPIRKSNYDAKTVEQMLLTKEQFKKSIFVMKKMKNRISKYNRDVIIPQAQQYYYAIQKQSSFNQDQQSHISKNNSILDQRTIEEPSSRSNDLYAPLEVSDDLAIAMRDPVSFNLPQFIKNINKPQQRTDHSMQLRNIQVDDQVGNLKGRRLTNSKSHTISQERSQSGMQPDILVNSIAQRDQDSYQFQRRSSDVIITTDASKYTTIQKSEGKERRMLSSQIRQTPNSKSEFRFKKKKNKRRLIVVDNSIQKNGVYNLLKEYGTDSQIEVEDSVRNDDQRMPNNTNSFQQKSTHTAFYPQDNLSLLLYAAQSASNSGAYPQPSQRNKFLAKANLATKFAQNQIQARRQLKKNNTLGKIYSNNNPRNLMLEVGALPFNQQMQVAAANQKQKQESVQRSSIRQSTRSQFEEPDQAEASRLIPRSNSFESMVNSLYNQDCVGVIQVARTVQNSSQKSFQKILTTETKQNGKHSAVDCDATSADAMRGPNLKETVREKFKKWLEKGRPNNTVTKKNGEYRRPGMVNLIASERIEDTQNISSNQVPNKKELSQDHFVKGIPKSDEDSESQTIIDIQKRRNPRKLNFAMAVQYLNDPARGRTIQERKVNLRAFIRENYPEEFQEMVLNISKNSSLGSCIYASHPKLVDIAGAPLYTQIDQRNILVQSQEPLNPYIFSSEQQQPHRMSYQPKDRTIEEKRYFVGSRELQTNDHTNLSQIYSVPSGKRRQVFLKNNYSKSGYLQNHTQKTNKMIEARKRKSPKFDDNQRLINTQSPQEKIHSVGEKPSLKLTIKQNTGSKVKTLVSSTKSRITKRPDVDPGLSQSPGINLVNSNYIGRTPGKLTLENDRHSALQRRNHHQQLIDLLDKEESYDHPQISLSMPQGAQGSEKVDEVFEGQIQDDDDVTIIQENRRRDIVEDVLIDHNLHILTESQDPTSLIDQLQERDVIDSGDITDVPQVLAENDKNPNLPEQADQIVGEQTVNDGDSSENLHHKKTPNRSFVERSIKQDTEENIRQMVPSPFKDDDDDQSKRNEDSDYTEHDVNDEEEGQVDDDEEYYADDKFVYEDVAEDLSCEDPEQKFLKEHAEKTARFSEGSKNQYDAESHSESSGNNTQKKIIQAQSHKVAEKVNQSSDNYEDDDADGNDQNENEEYYSEN